MRFVTEQLHCGEVLLESVSEEIQELSDTLSEQAWSPEFQYDTPSTTLKNQAAYNKSPSLIGDFSKGLVFGEVQFGNSATLYRDFYKFQFGLQNGLLSLAVL